MCQKLLETPTQPKKKQLLAEVFRQYGDEYIKNHKLIPEQHKAMAAIINCRTEAMGGYIAVCDHCGVVSTQYNSCHNRHCPTCQNIDRLRWVEKEKRSLLPIPYFHMVFTLPHDLNVIAQAHPAIIYNLLFKAASDTLKEFGRDPKWLGGELGITMVLHTWGQNLGQHIHVHCIVAAGALTSDKDKFIQGKSNYLFPVQALSKVFRGKYIAALKQAYEKNKFHFSGNQVHLSEPENFIQLIKQLYQHDWVVYAKKPFSGAEEVIQYIGRYTHRVALSNERILKIENGKVHFIWRDYADDNKKKIMILDAEEFIRRFMLHILPKRFMRIRHYGFLANRYREEKIALCRKLLGLSESVVIIKESSVELILRLTGVDIKQCPHCSIGKLQILSRIPDQYGKIKGPP